VIGPPLTGVGVCADESEDNTTDSETAQSKFFTFKPPAGVVSDTPTSYFG
jgi:hypothetical protein